MRATASCRFEIERWAYLRVIARPLCPSNSAMLPRGVPVWRKRLAKQSLKSCRRKFLIPAARTAGTNQCVG